MQNTDADPAGKAAQDLGVPMSVRTDRLKALQRDSAVMVDARRLGVGGGRQGGQPVEGLCEHVCAQCQVRLILRRGRRRGRAIRPMGDRMRQQPPVSRPPSLGGLNATGNTLHAQFLATEHWSLLATAA